MAYNFPSNPTLNQVYSYNGRTFKWNGVQWVAIVAPTSTSAPVFVSSSSSANPIVGDLWFNTVDSTLYVRSATPSGAFWIESYPGSAPAVNPPVTVSSVPPASASEGDLWYNPTTEELRVYYTSLSGGSWELVGGYTPPSPTTVHVSASAPNDPEEGLLWFNSGDDNLYVWVVTSGGGFWESAFSGIVPDPQVPVYISSSEPANPIIGYLWFNPETKVLKVRAITLDGPAWEAIAGEAISSPDFAKVAVSASAPTSTSEGLLWYNTIDDTLYVWVETLDGGYWTVANQTPPTSSSPTIRISSSPPADPVSGDLWYNPDNSNFSIWYEDLDGSQWVSVVPYPEMFPSQGGTFSGAIYADYEIPAAPNAFVTAQWVADRINQQGIPDTILTAKGSLVVATGNSTPAELTVGIEGEFLKVDSSASTGISWSNNVDCGAF
jgi:hypothetical protein